MNEKQMITAGPFGFGCYRVVDGDPRHEEALRLYLDKGGDLIDTSSNYGDGLSETLVGRVLEERGASEVTVVTKGGYIQGSNMALARERDFPEIVRYGPGIWHSIHPEFLRTQVDRSLERLRSERVDVYLLHNPEYYLEEIAHRREPTPEDHEEFYRRVREAFAFLEEEVEAGRIGAYGISSNNFGKPAPTPESPGTGTSVARCLEEACGLREDHHFRVVQLPLNLFEAGGALLANNEGCTVLELARRKGLTVLANRPLNAFHRGGLVRLADWVPAGEPEPGREELRAALAPLQEAEEELARELDERAPMGETETIARRIEELALQLEDPRGWDQAIGAHVIEPVQGWIASCRERHGEAWTARERDLLAKLRGALESAGRFLMRDQQEVSDAIRDRLRAAGHPWPEEPLSRMALGVLAGLDGLSCTLVGMRRPEYVEDVFAVLEREPIDGDEILASFASHS